MMRMLLWPINQSISFYWRIYKYIPADTAAMGVWYKILALGMRFLTTVRPFHGLIWCSNQVTTLSCFGPPLTGRSKSKRKCRLSLLLLTESVEEGQTSTRWWRLLYGWIRRNADPEGGAAFGFWFRPRRRSMWDNLICLPLSLLCGQSGAMDGFAYDGAAWRRRSIS